jgi:hypothetical protein
LEPGLLRAQAGYSTLTSLTRAHRFKHRTCATFPDIYRMQRPPHHSMHYHLTCARSLNETPLSCHSHMTMCANLNHLGLPAISNANAKSVQRHRVLRCPFSKIKYHVGGRPISVLQSPISCALVFIFSNRRRNLKLPINTPPLSNSYLERAILEPYTRVDD